MFERSGNGGEKRKMPVRLVLMDGGVANAQIVVNAGVRLIDAINKSEPFLEMEMADGSMTILSKQAIREISPLAAVPKADQLSRGVTTDFDPAALLGVAADATPEQIRIAYLAKVKQYHPDRLASMQLPREVEDYSASMLKRINAAYQFLSPRDAAA